jgi:hypothetical protein
MPAPSRGRGSRKQLSAPAPTGTAFRRTAPGHDASTGTASATLEETPPKGSAAASGAPAFEIGAPPDRNPRALQGRIEKIGLTRIEGWAWDPSTPHERINLELT